MTSPTLFKELNDALLDLQQAELQTFEWPLRRIAQILNSPEFEAVNRPLKAGVDLDAFLKESEGTGGSMVGSQRLVWPDDRKKKFGLTLVLIDRLAADRGWCMSFAHTYLYTGRKIMGDIRALTGQILVPFVRDYRAYVESRPSHPSPAPAPIAVASHKTRVAQIVDGLQNHRIMAVIVVLALVVIGIGSVTDAMVTIRDGFEKFFGGKGPTPDPVVVQGDGLRVDYCIFDRVGTCVPTGRCYGPNADTMGFPSDPNAREYSCKVACLEAPKKYPHVVDSCDMNLPYPGQRKSIAVEVRLGPIDHLSSAEP